MSEKSSTANPFLTILKRFWLPIVLFVLAVIFIVQNRTRTQTSLLWFSFNGSLWLTLTVVSVVAFGSGWFFGRRGGKSAE